MPFKRNDPVIVEAGALDAKERTGTFIREMYANQCEVAFGDASDPLNRWNVCRDFVRAA